MSDLRFPGNVVCDVEGCGWTQAVDNVFDYRDANCPKCGNPLMDVTDKAVMDAVAVLIGSGVAFAHDDPNRPAGTIGIRINSRQMKV